MVIRAIYDKPYNYDKSEQEQKRATLPTPSVSTDVRYINQTLFMTNPSNLRPTELTSKASKDEKASYCSMPEGYTFFSSKKPDRTMLEIIRNAAKATDKRRKLFS